MGHHGNSLCWENSKRLLKGTRSLSLLGTVGSLKWNANTQKKQFLLTCCGFLLSRTRWDPSKGEGGNAEAPEVLGGVLDEPGEATIHLERSGRAVLHQLERVPLAIGQHCVPDSAFHLPSHAGVRDVEDVAVSQLVKEISRGGMSATAAVQCREGKCNNCNFNNNLIHFILNYWEMTI